MGAQKTVHIKVDRCIPHDCRISCSNVGVYYLWVLVGAPVYGLSAFQPTSIIVSKNTIQLMMEVHHMGISVQGEKSLIKFFKRGEGTAVIGEKGGYVGVVVEQRALFVGMPLSVLCRGIIFE